MNRTQWTLAGLLIVQIALILFIRAGSAEADAPTRPQPLLPQLADAAAMKIEIDHDGEAAVVLEHDGTSWTIDQLDGFPADGNKVDKTLDTLRDLKVRRPVATSSRYHSSFEVADDDNQGRVRIWAEGDDDPRVDLILGKSPNYRELDIRRADADDVYEVSGLSAYDLGHEPADWAALALTDIPEDEVVGLRVSNTAGEFDLAHDDDGWRVVAPANLADRRLDTDKVGALVRAAAALRMAKPVGPVDRQAQRLDPPAATVVVRRRGEGEGAEPVSTTIEIGGVLPDDDSQRFVTREGFGFTGAVWNSSVKGLLERGVDELEAGKAGA